MTVLPFSGFGSTVHYRVIDLSVDGRRALLLDAANRVHVVHFERTSPERGVLLTGRLASLGAQALVAEGTGAPLEAVFECVACSQHEALSRMHPDADRSCSAGA